MKIVGTILLSLAFIALISANLQFWKMLEELGDKYPEKLDYYFGGWWHFLKYLEVRRQHKVSFPNSNRRLHVFALQLIGMALGFTGFCLIVDWI